MFRVAAIASIFLVSLFALSVPKVSATPVSAKGGLCLPCLDFFQESIAALATAIDGGIFASCEALCTAALHDSYVCYCSSFSAFALPACLNKDMPEFRVSFDAKNVLF
jgi:hypothetical protein